MNIFSVKKKALVFSSTMFFVATIISQADPSNWENLVDDGFDGTTNYFCTWE